MDGGERNGGAAGGSPPEEPVRGFLPPHAPGGEPARRWDLEDAEASARAARAAPVAAVPVQPPQPPAPPPATAQGWAPPASAPRYVDPGAPPRNPGAVAALVLGILAVGGVIITVGIFAPLTLGMAIAAWVLGRRATLRADREGLGQRGTAHAGFVLGVVGVVLSVLAIALWAVLLTDESFVRDLEREIERQSES